MNHFYNVVKDVASGNLEDKFFSIKNKMTPWMEINIAHPLTTCELGFGKYSHLILVILVKKRWDLCSKSQVPILRDNHPNFLGGGPLQISQEISFLFWAVRTK